MKNIFILVLPMMFAACVDGNKTTTENNSKTATNSEVTAVSPSNQQETKTTVNADGPANGSQGQLSAPKQTKPSAFTASPASQELVQEINRVLKLLGEQEVKIGGNDVPMEAAKASKAFMATYLKNRSNVSTWEEFVNVLANEPTTSGKPFFVVDRKNNRTPLGEYLNQLHNKK